MKNCNWLSLLLPTENPVYSIVYNGKPMLEKSPLGMNTNIGDFTKGDETDRTRCYSD